jgi:glycosyltransferase involved in cell wall biosynthesis
MCKMADAQALANAILQLKKDAALREGLARRGYEHCRDEFSIERQSERLQQIVLAVR